MPFVKTLPASGFYAVIFSSTKSDNLEGYAELDELTLSLAAKQPGYLGYESVANGNKGIFISYWESMESIHLWREHSTHQMAKAQANKWYKRYLSQVCFVHSNRLFETE